MNSKRLRLEWVIWFEPTHDQAIKQYIAQNSHTNIEQSTDKDGLIILSFHKTEHHDFQTWLTETLNLLNYHQNRDFFKLCEGSVIHIGLEAVEESDKFDLSLTGNQMWIMKQLSAVLDIDYYAYF